MEFAARHAVCPLCGSKALSDLPAVRGRAYAECAHCGIAFMQPADWPSPERARAEYDLHRNALDDPGYLAFLDRLAAPLAECLPAGARGLDFGCGPTPAMQLLFERRGFEMHSYDPIYAADAALLERGWDFVTCSEVAEHFTHPREAFQRLAALLAPGGRLAVMTQWRRPGHAFERWRYVHDPTHVCFYAEGSFEWMADWLGLQLERVLPNRVVMRRG